MVEKEHKSRFPIITVMGHVDHGKTTLVEKLISLEKKIDEDKPILTNEIGGITQKVSAYKCNNFILLDTPGHKLFSFMRQTILQVCDLILLVISAVEGVQDQNKEIISKLPENSCVIVVINKIDRNDKVDKIYSDLANLNILVDAYGGDVLCVHVSALKDIGINQLLELIQLQASMLNFNSFDNYANGFIIDTVLNKGGYMTRLLLKNGSIHIGDQFIIPGFKGKIKAIKINEENKNEAMVNDIIDITGICIIPRFGDIFTTNCNMELKIPGIKSNTNQDETTKDRLFLVKTSNIGQLDTLVNELDGRILNASIGDLSLAEVNVIKESGALLVILGDISKKTMKIIDENVIKYVNSGVIYELFELIEKEYEVKKEDVLEESGVAEIKKTFKMKGNFIAGCRVISGNIKIGQKSTVFRKKDEEIGSGNIISMKREKFDIKEAKAGSECGIIFDSKVAFDIGDHIISYKGQYDEAS